MKVYLKRSAIIVLAAVPTACSKPNPAPGPGAELRLFRTADEAGRLAIVNAESAVKLRLKDPGSAEFDTLKDLVGYLDGKPAIVCGQVNAKNAFGAYTGFQPWIANLTNGEVLMGADRATAQAACSTGGIQIAFGRS